jgi:hypothetical protein
MNRPLDRLRKRHGVESAISLLAKILLNHFNWAKHTQISSFYSIVSCHPLSSEAGRDFFIRSLLKLAVASSFSRSHRFADHEVMIHIISLGLENEIALDC